MTELQLPLRLGRHGSIAVKQLSNGSYRASSRFRLASGLTVLVSHQARTKSEAQANLLDHIRRNGDLMFDVLDLLLATPAGIGEVLALRWSDIDLDSYHPSVTISGTLVVPAGKGLYRQPKPKSKSGFRQVYRPAYACPHARVSD